jgi:RHS repeat-associated protein
MPSVLSKKLSRVVGQRVDDAVDDLLDHGLAVAFGTPAAPASYATTLGYDQLNRLLAVNWTPAPSQATPTASSSTFGYVYDATNRRMSQSATDNSWWYYPPAATKVGYTANNLNQYTAVGAVTPTYDGNGNLTSDGTFSYGYDAENRLISASASGLTATYSYDAQGRRKSKTVNGTTTIFVTDADNREVLEYSGNSGAIANWYAYALGPNDALNQMNVAGSTRETLIPDSQGSVVATLDSTTGALTKGGFLPYGESSSSIGSFRYTGQRIDPETNGLYYYRARMYIPAWGQFMQADPIGYFGGSNLYGYVRNDPLNFTDPFGLAPDVPQTATAAGGNGGNDDEPPKVAAALPAEEPQDNNDNNLGAGPDQASLRGGGSGGGGLVFSQTSASPFFNRRGTFLGQSIASVAARLRAGSLTPSEVPVRIVDVGGGPLIVNTRSALSLMQANIPQSQWNLKNVTGDPATEARIMYRLIKNGLPTSGTDVLRITRSGPNASTLIPRP